MKASLLASLEETIQNWMDTNCTDDNWPDCWVYDDLAEDMTKAAAAIMDACEKGQRSAEEF